ncbi:DUF4192 domain-containing protein [Streptomyces sp. FH025]|uniref:DUF4192 domain-containing protein n=1 Tax=Streptomyces sp. FH025 TaxID=2815937 RepID=UPI001A9E5B4E|nr:DUF4192 domain-containing protein [Streptomyces sp. FH025]MBO1418713.1 DUF4192 domain-containing protein [Streptomyces sp. FH025]
MTDKLLLLNGPEGLVHLLPFLFNYHPENSVVLAGITPTGTPLGFVRTDLPADPALWPSMAEELVAYQQDDAASFLFPTHRLVAYICPDPDDPDYGPQSRLTHQPIADHLREACGRLGLALSEAIYVTRSRYWSMLTTGPNDGHPIPEPPAELDSTSLPRSSDVLKSLAPATGTRATAMAATLDTAVRAMHADILSNGHQNVVDDAIDLVTTTIGELVTGAWQAKDTPDDLAARLLLALQYDDVRNTGLMHCEEHELAAANELWLALARRCPASYTDHAAIPLALHVFTAWALGDEATSRLALRAADTCLPDQDLTRFLLGRFNSGSSFHHLREHLREHRVTRGNPVTG